VTATLCYPCRREYLAVTDANALIKNSRIKIDQSFLGEILSQPDSAAIVKSVLGLAQDLRLEVVAEGVETREQFDYFRQTNCNEVQGYFIGQPMLFDQACRFLDAPKESAA
jgi:diguanylate cyclase